MSIKQICIPEKPTYDLFFNRCLKLYKKCSDKRVLCSTPQSCLTNVCTKQNLRKIIELRGIKNLSGFNKLTSDYSSQNQLLFRG